MVFDVDKDGKMSIDKTMFNAELDTNPTNVEAFFTGGSFTKTDLSVVTLTGAFNGFYDIVNGYAKTNGGLRSSIKIALVNTMKLS
ncbi:MAG: flagellar filament capping protein FliD [Sulfurimonas sp.]|nr:flagellar filament capping protein FliD [Sulfurimonas sp.]